MDRRLSLLGVGFVLAVGAAACGGSSTPTASSPGDASAAAPTAAATEAPAASEPAASEPAASADAGGPDVSFSAGAAADLEAKLPDKAGSITFSKASFDGASLGTAGLPLDAGELQPLLDKYGKTVNDVRVAMATPADAASGATTTVFAMQIKGVPAEEILTTVGGELQTEGMKDQTIDGKQVKVGGSGPFTVALYLKDDTFFYVLFADEATLKDIVANFP